MEDVDSLCSFQHYRIPWNDTNSNLLIRCDYNYAIDFLDTIDSDIPEGRCRFAGVALPI
jgi:radial spoke head protein 9